MTIILLLKLNRKDYSELLLKYIFFLFFFLLYISFLRAALSLKNNLELLNANVFWF